MNRKIRLFVALGAILAGAASTAMAADDYNKTVAATGVQAGTGYFRTNEPLSVNCQYNVIYIANLSTDAGQRAMYATVLAALNAGQHISHVNYNVDASGLCTAALVESSP